MSLPILSKRVRGKEGTALIISLLILIVLTLIGVYAVFTSTVETRITGNERLLELTFYAADGGTDYGRRMIEVVLNNEDFPAGAKPKPDENTFRDEVRGFDTTGSPWVAPVIGDCNMTIPVDRLRTDHIPGGSAEFGGGAAATMAIYYQVDSTATTAASSESQVRTTYRRMLP